MNAQRPRVVLARRIPAPIERLLAERFDLVLDPDDRPLTTDALIAAARDADALVPTVTDRVTAEVIAAAPRLRIIANYGAGTDNIDLEAARAAGVVVTNTPGVLTDDTADLAMYLMLATVRRVREAECELRDGAWSGWRPTHVFGATLRGKTLGIVGFGRIGQAVARRALASGMRVQFVTRTLHAVEGASLPPAAPAPSLEALLRTSDVVSLHTPATPGTRHLLDASRLAMMRPSAVLVNTARGALVDEGALARALAEGTIAGAGLDVYEAEPRVHPGLLTLPNVVLLPHIGSATRETREAMGRLVLENLVAFFERREVENSA